MGKEQNLIPMNKRSESEQRRIQSMGGRASGESKRERIRISRILAEYLQKEHEVELRDSEGKLVNKESLTAAELIDRTVTAILMRGDSASKGMIDSLANITEGQKINLDGFIATGKLSREERKERIKALKAKLDG